nr:MAG TPA: hypothetical protein [Caudoviricetes sp.]
MTEYTVKETGSPVKRAPWHEWVRYHPLSPQAGSGIKVLALGLKLLLPADVARLNRRHPVASRGADLRTLAKIVFETPSMALSSYGAKKQERAACAEGKQL